MDEQFEHNSLVETEDVNEHEFELNHSDKLVGVFAEPAKTFEKIANTDAKASDWLFPLILTIIVGIIANIVMMSNPTIKYSLVEKQMKQIEERFDDMVKSGQMSKAQKEQQLSQTRDFMENQMGAQMIITSVAIVVLGFVFFFIVSGVFFAVAKFGLKGDLSYMHALSAYGLPQYILVIQAIVIVILAFVMDRFFEGTSVAAIMKVDQSTLYGWFLSKVDVISIWFYAVTAVAFAKVSKAPSMGKYFAMVFGLWLGASLIFFYLKEAIPFLKMFGM